MSRKVRMDRATRELGEIDESADRAVAKSKGAALPLPVSSEREQRQAESSEVSIVEEILEEDGAGEMGEVEGADAEGGAADAAGVTCEDSSAAAAKTQLPAQTEAPARNIHAAPAGTDPTVGTGLLTERLDWTCKSCDTLNFGFSNKCSKCKRPILSRRESERYGGIHKQ